VKEQRALKRVGRKLDAAVPFDSRNQRSVAISH
jgi:hypothetical protein